MAVRVRSECLVVSMAVRMGMTVPMVVFVRQRRLHDAGNVVAHRLQRVGLAGQDHLDAACAEPAKSRSAAAASARVMTGRSIILLSGRSRTGQGLAWLPERMPKFSFLIGQYY